jgi:Tetratricopeptide repeat
MLILEQLRKEAGGDGTHTLAVAHSALAKASIDVGLLEEATEQFQRSKEIREGLPGFFPVAKFSPLLGLGCICLLKKDFDSAAALFEEVLEDRERALGRDDREGIW